MIVAGIVFFLMIGGSVWFAIKASAEDREIDRRRIEILTHGYVQRAINQKKVDPMTYLVEHYDLTTHREQETAILNAMEIIRIRNEKNSTNRSNSGRSNSSM